METLLFPKWASLTLGTDDGVYAYGRVLYVTTASILSYETRLRARKRVVYVAQPNDSRGQAFLDPPHGRLIHVIVVFH